MNPEYEKRLEAEISRELKSLPELAAPAALVNRVMTALAERARVPWYRRSWQMWPGPLQTASLVVLLALFGGLCFAGRELSHAQATTLALHRVGEGFSQFGVITNTLSALVNAAWLAVMKLGTGFIAACLVTVGLAYVLCVGLGTMYFRLALAKQRETNL
jgi:predicted lysophospholipase L1 biosynthesis ABC-type transport system permease subunit